MRPALLACGPAVVFALACGSGSPIPAVTGLPEASVSAEPTVAVLPWQQSAGGEDWSGLGPGLAGVVTSELSSVEGITLVERARLDALLAEVALGGSGFLDASTAQRMGRGVGAELVVVGSYSVLPDGFLMDGRVVRVETGEIVVAGTARSALDDWTTASEAVVAKLASQLGTSADVDVEDAPLVQVAAYGRGLDAERRGDVESAREAFEVAAGWRFADARLADLDATLTTKRAELDAIQDRWRKAALEQLPPDTAHSGRPTAAQGVDAVLRWGVLAAEGKHCALAAEQEHWLARNGWRAPNVSRSALERRRKALGLDDDPVLGRFGFDAPDTPQLLYGPDPIDVHDGWLSAVQACEASLGPVLGAWERAIEGVGPGKVDGEPLQLELQAGHAWLVARHTGTVPRSFTEAVDRVGTRAAVGRGEEVAEAARDFELRGSFTDAELVALAEAITRGDGKRLKLSDRTCAIWATGDARYLQQQLPRMKEGGIERFEVEMLGETAWLYAKRGCLRDRGGQYPDAKAVVAAAEGAARSGECDATALQTELDIRRIHMSYGETADHERALLVALRQHLQCR